MRTPAPLTNIVLCLGLGLGACAQTYRSPARFTSRAPTGGTIATPSAAEGMGDAVTMIAAHCGAGGYRISREGEAVVGATVVSQGSGAVDTLTTDGAGQLQQQTASKTTLGSGSQWEIHYECNDPTTATMGLITADRTTSAEDGIVFDVAATGGVFRVQGEAHEAFGGQLAIGYKLQPQLALRLGAAFASTSSLQEDYGVVGRERESVQGFTAMHVTAGVAYALSDKTTLGLAGGLGCQADYDDDDSPSECNPALAIDASRSLARLSGNVSLFLGVSLAVILSEVDGPNSSLNPMLRLGIQKF